MIYVSLNRVVQPRQASVGELSAFHSLDYIECLEQLANDDEDEKVADMASECGLGMIAPTGERETRYENVNNACHLSYRYRCKSKTLS